MADGRKNNGGSGRGQGRKPKIAEIKLIETMDSILVPANVWQKLADLVEEKDIQAIKTWIQYRFGMPKQIVDNNINMQSGFPTLEQFYGKQVEESDE